MGSLSLLWGIFLTQGWNPGLLHCRQILSCLSHQGSPLRCSPKNGYDGNSYVMHFEPQLKKEGLFFSSYKLTTPGPFWLSIHHSSDGSQKLSVAYVARFSPPEAWGFPPFPDTLVNTVSISSHPWSLRVSPLPWHSGEHWPHFQLPGLVSLWSAAFSCKQSPFCLHSGSQKCLAKSPLRAAFYKWLTGVGGSIPQLFHPSILPWLPDFQRD